MKKIAFTLLAFCVCPAFGAQDDTTTPALEEPYVLQAESEKFVGHYYLSGLMETGSELLLRKDGKYQWFLSVGSLDQMSSGIWSHRNGMIVLLADRPPADKSMFLLQPVLSWSIEAEQVARKDAIYEQNLQVIRTCKFLSDEGGSSIADNAMSPPYQDVTPELLEKSRQADDDELRLRSAYELAASMAMEPAAQQPEMHDLARKARLAWRAAWNHRRQAESDAKLRFQQTPEPAMPEPCQLNWSDGYVDPQTTEQWTDGLAVQLIAPETGASLDRISVIFQFSDGSQITRSTQQDGIAWIKVADGGKVTGITLDLPEENNLGPQKFAFAPVDKGIIPINVNSSYGSESPFEVMQLTVNGAALIGFEGRGQYQRAQ